MHSHLNCSIFFFLNSTIVLCLQEPSEEPFDVKSVPKEVKSKPIAEPTGLRAPPAAAPAPTVDTYERLLSSIPEFSSFGKPFKVILQHIIYIHFPC